ncbi:hypothetical protein [Burkholderia metallica]|uniref:hypothetical protein n=1 Tax=Burkholderia metallica TaxID=488729 RepID=UPI0020C6CD9A|nr:hypothetical protein [Burkholderia metallica]
MSGALRAAVRRDIDVTPALAYHVVYPAHRQDDPRIVALRGWLADEVAMGRA